MPKFLCVKGILFFSFWQGIFVSILVAAGVISKLGPYTDSEHISLALTDAMVCMEMPLFAIAHQYAFSTIDFVDPHAKYVARMPMWYAFRDAFGLKDVVEDSKATLRGEGMDYREFEPSEGYMHQGAGRDRRIRAGLRYSQGGRRKYWLPQTTGAPGPLARSMNRAIERVTGRPGEGEEVRAPLLPQQADGVVHLAPDLRGPAAEEDPVVFGLDDGGDDADGFELPFGDPDEADEELFRHSRKYLFGDYNYPVVDVSSEAARLRVWDEEERILRDERGVFFSPIHARRAYGAVGARSRHSSDLSDSERVRGKRVASPARRQMEINKETDRLSDAQARAQPNAVHLGWTKPKLGALSPPQPPRIRKLSTQGKAGTSSGGSSSASSATSSPRERPLPSPRNGSERSPLPPDAVDLVVEDSHPSHEESYRRGSPTLRKVYRRGFLAEDDDEGVKHGEVEVEARNEENTPFAVGEDVDAILDTEEAVVEEMTATRAATPPAHTRIVVDSYDDLHESNPWA